MRQPLDCRNKCWEYYPNTRASMLQAKSQLLNPFQKRNAHFFALPNGEIISGLDSGPCTPRDVGSFHPNSYDKSYCIEK